MKNNPIQCTSGDQTTRVRRITSNARLMGFLGALLITCYTSAQTNNNATSTLTNTTTHTTYNTAIGLRGGQTSGLTIKHFTGSVSAVEAIVGFWPRTLSVTGLFEHYVPAEPEGLNWYYGGGGHAAFSTGVNYYNPEGRYYYRSDEVGLGIDGMLGVEYKIPPIPFALSLDIKPFLEVTTRNRVFVALDPGIGIKVAF